MSDTIHTSTGLGEEFRRAWGLAPRAADAPPAPEPDVSKLIEEQRMQNFRRFCPEEFLRPIDRKLIPNGVAWDQGDAWTGSFPGIWLWSTGTGEAKTRLLWRLFGRFHVRQGKTVIRVTGLSLAEDYGDAVRHGRTERFYARFPKHAVVMLDDLDKMVLPTIEGERQLGFAEDEQASRNARMLRELFDGFYEEHTPVLVTANRNIAWFAARCGPSTERRMMAVCKEIEL